MKMLPYHCLSLLSAATLMLCSCETARQVPFNEADFIPSTKTGSGSVVGQAYVIVTPHNWGGLLGGKKDTNYTENGDVLLLPVNPYTTEVMQKKYLGGAKLAHGDPRYYKYGRGTTTDGQGNFQFHGIPTGDYYVCSAVTWDTEFDYYDDDGSPDSDTFHNSMMIYAQVSVRNGQTTTVTQWNQGPQKKSHDLFSFKLQVL